MLKDIFEGIFLSNFADDGSLMLFCYEENLDEVHALLSSHDFKDDFICLDEKEAVIAIDEQIVDDLLEKFPELSPESRLEDVKNWFNEVYKGGQ